MSAPGRIPAVEPLSAAMRAGDVLLGPAMWLLGGFQRDSLQETHHWHCRPIDDGMLDRTAMAHVVGDEPGPVFANRVFPFPRFHAPVFGGWRRYVVLRVAGAPAGWHVGWVHRATPAGARPRSHVNRLLVTGEHVRVLKQARGFVTDFFAVTPGGDQLPVHVVDDGTLGSDRHPDIRLF